MFDIRKHLHFVKLMKRMVSYIHTLGKYFGQLPLVNNVK